MRDFDTLTAMNKPGLLLRTAAAERLLGGALADRFEFIRLWEADDPDAALAARGSDVVATLTTSLNTADLDCLPNLQLVAVPGAGYENIDIAEAEARGITVVNAGDAHSGVVADHAVALVLASVHRLAEMHTWVRNGNWRSHGSPARRRGMSGQRFGIVGLGNIGTAIAERLSVFGGEIAWWAPRDKRARWPRVDSLIELARWATVLIVATRGDAVGLIDAETIAEVGPYGLIVNISRGHVIDENALISALDNGKLGQAALDVFEHEPTSPERWSGVPNVILTPHVGGVSDEAFSHLRAAAIRNLTSVLDGGSVVNRLTK